MLNDPLANILNKILNAHRVGKSECIASPVSKTILKVLTIMQAHKYLGEVELLNKKILPKAKINLIGSINKCAAVKPRFSVKKGNYEKFEKRYLPAKDIGLLIVSTSKGIMTHHEAKKKNMGGVLLAYVY